MMLAVLFSMRVGSLAARPFMSACTPWDSEQNSKYMTILPVLYIPSSQVQTIGAGTALRSVLACTVRTKPAPRLS